MKALREGLPPVPPQLADAPISESGYPVPWFVAWPDGKPDFRVSDPSKIVLAINERRCWTCGGILGAHKVYAVGPMCVVNRVSSEPPSHRACAEYAAKACPFLTDPKRRRRTKDMPEGSFDVGEAIKRNPGVTCLWTTKKVKIFRVDRGVLFHLEDPTDVTWFTEGRDATREEVADALESGMPSLRALADTPESMKVLNYAYDVAKALMPKAVPT